MIVDTLIDTIIEKPRQDATRRDATRRDTT